MDTIKVLLVDDDVMLSSIITTALKDEGYEVHYQSSLTGITTILNEFKPDIMVLDVEIGTGDSIDNASELKMAAPGTPILYISSHTESHEVARALKSGAVAYLKKPFSVEELIGLCRQTCSSCFQCHYKDRLFGVGHSNTNHLSSIKKT